MPDPNWQTLTTGTDSRSPVENYDAQHGKHKEQENPKTTKAPPAEPSPFKIKSA